MRFIATLSVLIVILATVACQRHVGRVTLQMEWHRGDLYYGPNFISMSAPCQSASFENCECHASFKNKTSDEFADYIASFQGRKVPVTYDLYDVSQGHIGAKLVSVGTWRAERFRSNDGVLALGITGVPGKSLSAHAEDPGDCFPVNYRVKH